MEWQRLARQHRLIVAAICGSRLEPCCTQRKPWPSAYNSSTSTEHGPAIVRIKKLQALVDFISNCAFLILSIGTAYILYVWSHS